MADLDINCFSESLHAESKKILSLFLLSVLLLFVNGKLAGFLQRCVRSLILLASTCSLSLSTGSAHSREIQLRQAPQTSPASVCSACPISLLPRLIHRHQDSSTDSCHTPDPSHEGWAVALTSFCILVWCWFWEVQGRMPDASEAGNLPEPGERLALIWIGCCGLGDFRPVRPIHGGPEGYTV